MNNAPEYDQGGGKALKIVSIVCLVLLAALLVFTVIGRRQATERVEEQRIQAEAMAKMEQQMAEEEARRQQEAAHSQEPADDPEPEPVDFTPHCTDATHPDCLVKATAVQDNGELVESYQAAEQIRFDVGSKYTQTGGIVTFRGNNFRDGASGGKTTLTEKKFGQTWTMATASLQAPDGAVWTGHGWTGQPLVMPWPKDVRQHMTNMKDWARQQDTLTEVIYAGMDGYVYFAELSTGKPTRDRLNLGFTFKGSGALDPRGYPLLYVGAGYDGAKSARALVVSLLDGSVLYEFGNNDSFALRAWHMFDSSPLVDAETDQLIWPGESGILYLIKLNTQYDPDAGTISVNPTTVKWRYNGVRTGTSYWLGMEASAVIWQGHIIMADNGGILMCLDLDTLQLDWVQDTLDDTNSTPVLELEDGHPYVYISTSFHSGWRTWNATAPIPVWKIDAVTGEVVWRVDYDCYTVSGVSGGVQGTIALGKNNVSDLVFIPVARTGNGSAGKLVALDKATGETVWSFDTQMYSWSSPTLFYDADGNGYIIYCTSGYYMYLLDAKTGQQLDSMNLGGNMEASPIVYDNTVVIGTRAQQIWGVTLK